MFIGGGCRVDQVRSGECDVGEGSGDLEYLDFGVKNALTFATPRKELPKGSAVGMVATFRSFFSQSLST